MADAPKKLNVFTLGELGINRTKAPTQVKDGELLLSQNATTKTIKNQLALIKRDGIAPINDEAMPGPILSMVNIPLADLVEVDPYNVVACSSTGGNSRVQFSADGETWTLSGVNVSHSIGLRSIAYSPQLGVFVAIGTQAGTGPAQVLYSDDVGETWTVINVPGSPSASWQWTSIAWSPALSEFVGVNTDIGSTGYRMMHSEDGLTWTLNGTALPTIGASDPINRIVWVPELEKYIACGAEYVGSSTDGHNWTFAAVGSSLHNYKGLAYSPALGRLVLTSQSTSNGTDQFQYSDDGVNWNAVALFTATRLQWQSVAWSPTLNLFVAVSQSRTVDGNNYNMAYSANGVDWTPLASPAGNVSHSSVTWNSAIGKFVVVIRGSSTVLNSTDGINWTTHTSAISQDWEHVR